MRGADELDDVDDSVIFPKSSGKKLIFLDKESVLSRLSDKRNLIKQRVVDRFFYLSRQQSYYYTSIYVMAEVFSTVCSGGSGSDVADLRKDTLNSSIEIQHGVDPWDSEDMTETPKTIFLGATDVLEQREDIDCKFPEAALVVQAAAADANYVFSYDEAVRKLSESFGLTTLPHTELWKE